VVVAGQGHFHGNEVAKVQPTKLAAMEAHWETQKGAPIYLLALPSPDPDAEENLVEALPVPGLLSMLAYNDPGAEVKGLKDFPKDERPPVFITFSAFRTMVGLGTLFPILAGAAWLYRNRLHEKRWLMRVLVWAIPLPYIALQAGWAVAEVGRQPWIVYGLMRTSDAVSPALDSMQVGTSLAAFLLVYGALGAIDVFLLRKYAIANPE
jgi:cytochrome d ubiquinol oxidase subunit I